MASVFDGLFLMAGDKPLAQDQFPHWNIGIATSVGYFTAPDGVQMPIPATYYSALSGKRAPLVVYLPGIFQDQEDMNSHQAVRELLLAGNSVLIIPNPLTATYMANFPNSPPANLPAEAEVALATVDGFVSQHREEISSVHLAGASYGAFVAAIAIAKDSTRANPAFDGQTTLIFPPFNMEESRERLDKMIDSYQDSSLPVTPSALIAKAFQQALLELLARMKDKYLADRRFGFIARRYRPGPATLLMNFNFDNPLETSALRFWTVIRRAIEVTVPFYMSKQADISYWLDTAKAHGNQRIRILTTDDDWLSNPKKWESLPNWMQNEDHLLIHTGRRPRWSRQQQMARKVRDSSDARHALSHLE